MGRGSAIGYLWGLSFHWFRVNFILSSRYEVRTIIPGVWPLSPHGYGTVLSLTFAQGLAEVLSPPQRGTTETQGLRRRLSCLAKKQGLPAWAQSVSPAGKHRLDLPKQLLELQHLPLVKGTQPYLTLPPPPPWPGSTNCSLLSVPAAFAPAAVKALAVGCKYISAQSRAVFLNFCLSEILYNLNFFIPVAMGFTQFSVSDIRVETIHGWFRIPLGSSLLDRKNNGKSGLSRASLGALPLNCALIHSTVSQSFSKCSLNSHFCASHHARHGAYFDEEDMVCALEANTVGPGFC